VGKVIGGWACNRGVGFGGFEFDHRLIPLKVWLRRDETGERQPGYRRDLCLRPGAIVQAQLSEFV
jgi:hypothetical protein